MAGNTQARRGRPIDPYVDAALRSATLEVLSESGWRGVTVEKIAERAGVARTTIYRRHGSVEGVMLLVMDDIYSASPVPDTGALRGDLVLVVRETLRSWRDSARVDFLCAIMAAKRESPELSKAYSAQFASRRADSTKIVVRAVARKEIRPQLDPSLLLDLLSGVLAQRVLIMDELLPDDFAEQVVDAVLIGFATP